MENILALIEKYKVAIGMVLLAGATVGGVYILRPQDIQTDTDFINAIDQRLIQVEKKLDTLGQVKGETVQATPAQSIVTPSETKIPESSPVLSQPIQSNDAVQQQSPASATVNINAATAQELDSLPGIGPTYAQRIIDYRTSNGGFKSIEEIKKVKGIGDKTFEKFEDKISI